jgi:uncharacterized protein (TIRG00374 family)
MSRKRIALIILGIIAIIGGTVIFTDGKEILRVLEEASWEKVPFVLVFVSLSYFLTSYSFARVNRLLGIPIDTPALTQIGFTTTAINHLLTTGGLAGYSLRYLLMRRRGVRMKEVMTTSVLHFYLTSLIMLGMLPIGLVMLLMNSSIGLQTSIIVTAIAVLVLLLFSIATGLVFKPAMRRPILRFVSKIARSLLKQDLDSQLRQFDTSFTHGVEALRRQPQKMSMIVGMIFGDWLASAIALWFCFDALGPSVHPADLIAGFVIGVVAGVISMIPGGLGIQEGSMAGIFSLLGTSFEQAILASILFRVVYYILPYLISLFWSWRLLNPIEDSEAPIEEEVKNANSNA